MWVLGVVAAAAGGSSKECTQRRRKVAPGSKDSVFACKASWWPLPPSQRTVVDVHAVAVAVVRRPALMNGNGLYEMGGRKGAREEQAWARGREFGGLEGGAATRLDAHGRARTRRGAATPLCACVRSTLEGLQRGGRRLQRFARGRLSCTVPCPHPTACNPKHTPAIRPGRRWRRRDGSDEEEGQGDAGRWRQPPPLLLCPARRQHFFWRASGCSKERPHSRWRKEEGIKLSVIAN